jgi:hypothetical protein
MIDYRISLIAIFLPSHLSIMPRTTATARKSTGASAKKRKGLKQIVPQIGLTGTTIIKRPRSGDITDKQNLKRVRGLVRL